MSAAAPLTAPRPVFGQDGAMPDAYTHGHHESVLRSHRWRTAENSAAYLLPELAPGLDVLDVGAGPGTITLDLAARVAPGNRVSSALAVLPKTLWAICSTESRCEIAENCTVDSRLSEPDSLSLKSCKPSQPTLRQKRITVGWLTLASEAIVLIELLTNHCG